MNNDLKKQIDNKNSSFGFIKTTDAPLQELSDQQKVALNRKANALFNEGKTDLAERIFITTGYSDGLTRVGGVYEKIRIYKGIKAVSSCPQQKKK